MKTTIAIEGNRFYINGQPTYAGRMHQGRVIEGLLFNSRMINAIFDDENPVTAARWHYPDTGRWDAGRNTDEFCAALPLYARYGLLGVTVGLQGGGAIYIRTCTTITSTRHFIPTVNSSRPIASACAAS